MTFEQSRAEAKDTPKCPACKGRRWVTPNIQQYPGDRVACSRCAVVKPAAPVQEAKPATNEHQAKSACMRHEWSGDGDCPQVKGRDEKRANDLWVLQRPHRYGPQSSSPSPDQEAT